MKTIEELEIDLRSRRQAELFALFEQCREVGHAWQELKTDLVVEGRQAHYCTRCLRVAVGGGAEFWPVVSPNAEARHNVRQP